MTLRASWDTFTSQRRNYYNV